MKILLLGANGQVGQAFQDLSKTESFPIGWELISLSRAEGDLANPTELLKKIESVKPDVILNSAAYTQVDQAESEVDLCEQINGKTPGLIAAYASRAKIPLVHFSTDYVYDGAKAGEHVESESIHPGNAYGLSKSHGDEAIQKSGCDYLIFRTSWVYSFVGKNFVRTMIRLGSTKTELNVVNDQVGSPTYAPDLAVLALDALMQGMEQKSAGRAFPSGVYHLCNSGFTTWAEFAQAILPKVKVNGIPTKDYPTPAKRPLNSKLSLEKFKTTFGQTPRPWQAALKECLKKLGEAHA